MLLVYPEANPQVWWVKHGKTWQKPMVKPPDLAGCNQTTLPTASKLPRSSMAKAKPEGFYSIRSLCDPLNLGFLLLPAPF